MIANCSALSDWRNRQAGRTIFSGHTFVFEMKEFGVGVRARVVLVSVELRAVVLIQLVLGVAFDVPPSVHGGEVNVRCIL